jgi:hypothetical protein
LEEIGADDGQCDGFSIKLKHIHLFKVEMGMEYAMSTLMLGNGTLEGIYGTATHELGHSWFQQMNQNIGWMRDLQPMFQI